MKVTKNCPNASTPHFPKPPNWILGACHFATGKEKEGMGGEGREWKGNVSRVR